MPDYSAIQPIRTPSDGILHRSNCCSCVLLYSFLNQSCWSSHFRTPDFTLTYKSSSFFEVTLKYEEIKFSFCTRNRNSISVKGLENQKSLVLYEFGLKWSVSQIRNTEYIVRNRDKLLLSLVRKKFRVWQKRGKQIF